MRTRTSRISMVWLVVGLAILLAAGLLGSGALSSSMEQIANDATLAREQSDAAEDVLFTLQKAETGQRGYLLTGRASYLQPYREAASGIGPALSRLEALASGTPWMREDAAALQDIARRKMDELGRTVALAQSAGRDAAIALVLTDAGQVEMEGARRAVDRINRRIEAEREAEAAALRHRRFTMEVGSAAALVAGVILLGAVAMSLIRSRAALARARERERLQAAGLQAAIDHFRDGVAVFDAQGRLTLRNARFAATLGLDEEAVGPGARLAELADVPLDPPALRGNLAAQGPDVAVETRLEGRTLEIWRSGMPAGGEMIAVADISRRVEAEAIARQAQKLETVGQMTGGIAHDFNNLLQVISVNLEMALRRLMRAGADPAVIERLEAASAGVVRGAGLTRHLLAFARRQKLAPEPIDAGRLLRGLEDMLRRTLGEAVELEILLGPGLWTMRADPTQMETALLNLAVNARDAMTHEDGVPSGRAVIEAANVTVSEREARAGFAVGDYVLVSLSDTGVGMTSEQLRRALEPFYTTKPEGKGTGLGLPMVLGFAQQSRGYFELASTFGEGTTARLYLPRTTESIEQPAHPQAQARGGAGELVVLVEDDPEVRRVAAASLRSLGYEVGEAVNADGALALLKSGVRPALLFIDVVIPGSVSARELAGEARAMVPGLAVLFTSGYVPEAGDWAGQAAHFLKKPWRTDELGRALRAALDDAGRIGAKAVPARVLLVEDDALIRLTTVELLQDAGFEVLEAESGAAALAQLDRAPAVLIADLGLPDMNGMALIEAARARWPELPVIVASGASEAARADLIYLAKPFDSAALQAAIDAALGTRVVA